MQLEFDEETSKFYIPNSSRKNKSKTFEEKRKKTKEYQKRLNLNWQTKRDLGYQVLEVPEFVGYKKFFDLRDDIAKSDIADQLRRILKVINNEITSRKGDFLKWDNKIKRKVPMELKLKIIEKKDMDKLISKGELLLEDLKYFSIFSYTINYFTGFTREVEKYVFMKPWMFKEVTKKRFIDKKLILDSELEKRDSWLSNKLWNVEKMSQKYDEKYRHYHDYDWEGRIDRIEKKLIKKELYEVDKTINE